MNWGVPISSGSNNKKTNWRCKPLYWIILNLSAYLKAKNYAKHSHSMVVHNFMFLHSHDGIFLWLSRHKFIVNKNWGLLGWKIEGHWTAVTEGHLKYLPSVDWLTPYARKIWFPLIYLLMTIAVTSDLLWVSYIL